MNPLTEDLWEIILARLPIKVIKSSKLVCKQWKSIVESPYFRDLFLSLHKNSHCSSWSLMFSCSTREIVAHYGCDTWGLPRSLGFYISSFLTNKFKTQNGRYKAWVYTDDVGLILISENYFCAKNRSLYVANPISQECVRIPSHAHLNEYSRPLGMATQTKNGIFLGYKIVVVDFPAKPYSLSIFSSETGLWSHKTVHEHFPWRYNTAISLHENIHWLAGISDQEEGVVTMDLYATGSIQCRVTPFPDSGKHPRFIRSLSTCQGSLMYMNIVSVSKVDGSVVEDKLCVWRLTSGEWQLVSEITPTFIETGFEYFPLGINPFDDKKVYFWSNKDKNRLLSINLCNGRFVIHSELEHSGDGCTLSSVECKRALPHTIEGSHFPLYFLPRWLHRIPVRSVLKESITTSLFPSNFKQLQNNLNRKTHWAAPKKVTSLRVRTEKKMSKFKQR